MGGKPGAQAPGEFKSKSKRGVKYMVFQWKSTASLIGAGVRKMDPQPIGEHLEELSKKSGGGVTPQQVVDDARDPSAPTHGVFEWDDAAAAGQHRLQQARMLISAIVTVSEVPGTREPHRVFVSVETEGGNSRYEPLVTVLSDVEKRHQFLLKAMHEFEAWKERYESYEELAGIFAAAEKVKASIVEPTKESASAATT